MAHIQRAAEVEQAGTLTISLSELRILMHRLAPEDSSLRERAEPLLPEGHEQIARDLSEQLDRFHDWGAPQ